MRLTTFIICLVLALSACKKSNQGAKKAAAVTRNSSDDIAGVVVKAEDAVAIQNATTEEEPKDAKTITDDIKATAEAYKQTDEYKNPKNEMEQDAKLAADALSEIQPEQVEAAPEVLARVDAKLDKVEAMVKSQAEKEQAQESSASSGDKPPSGWVTGASSTTRFLTGFLLTWQVVILAGLAYRGRDVAKINFSLSPKRTALNMAILGWSIGATVLSYLVLSPENNEAEVAALVGFLSVGATYEVYNVFLGVTRQIGLFDDFRLMEKNIKISLRKQNETTEDFDKRLKKAIETARGKVDSIKQKNLKQTEISKRQNGATKTGAGFHGVIAALLGTFAIGIAIDEWALASPTQAFYARVADHVNEIRKLPKPKYRTSK